MAQCDLSRQDLFIFFVVVVVVIIILRTEPKTHELASRTLCGCLFCCAFKIILQDNTCGAAIPPILATRLQVPNAADRTTVGNNSVVYKNIMLKEAAMPKRPISATAVCALPVTNALRRHPVPAIAFRKMRVRFRPKNSTENCANAYEGISTRPDKKLFR
uniref:Uncharacterized protein n=1 Tax=Mantoniella antarctica TaxID=81844 RepID=A0A7S0XAV2_9CHLO